MSTSHKALLPGDISKNKLISVRAFDDAGTPAGTSSATVAAMNILDTLPDGFQHMLPDPVHTKDATNGWIWGNHSAATAAQQAKFKEVVLSKKASFAYSVRDLVGYSGKLGPFEIQLKTDAPIFERQRHHSKVERAVQDEKCQELLAAGIIEECQITAYASCPTMPVKKDSEGKWTDRRFCIDYRRLNDQTVADKYGLHMPEELFQRIGTAGFLSKLDCRAGFHQIPVKDSDAARTAFWWGNKTFQFKRMPFGLRNATAKFQRVMDFEIAKAQLDHCCCAFVDDCLVYSKTMEEHIAHVAAVLDMLHSCGLRAHPDKSIFGSEVIEFLGHNVSSYGLTPHAARVAAILAIKPPRNLTELRSALGIINYYRCYIPNFSQLANPLHLLLRKGVVWRWGESQQASFETLKTALATEGKALRRLDPAKPLLVHTDWSKQGMGAILGQIDEDGNEYMCACISRSFNKHEQNNCSYKGEMLAAVWAIKTFRPYLHGVEFTLVTDHQPLAWLMGSKNLTGQYARWALSLQEYDFTVKHRAGDCHQNADALSRNPHDNSFDGTGARLDDDDDDDDDNDNDSSKQIKLATRPGPAAALCFSPGAGGTCSTQELQSWLTPPVSHVASTYAPQHELAEDSVLNSISYSLSSPADLRGSEESQTKLRQLVNRVSSSVAQVLASTAVIPPTPIKLPQGSRPCSINTSLIADSFFKNLNDGVVILEATGGLCTGLHALLSNGMRVAQYLCCEPDAVAQRIVRQRLQQLTSLYPHLLPPTATEAALTSLPSSLSQVTQDHLAQQNARGGQQWIVIGSWQHEQPSGPAFKGNHQFNALMNLIRVLQRMQTNRPPAYACWMLSAIESLGEQKAQPLLKQLGTPVCVQATKLGSTHTQTVSLWTNVAAQQELRPVMNDLKMPATPATQDGGVEGIAVLEQALGYAAGSSDAPRITTLQRQKVLANTADCRVVQHFWAAVQALSRWHKVTESPKPQAAVTVVNEHKQQVMEDNYGVGYCIVAAQGWLPHSSLNGKPAALTEPVTLPHRHHQDKSGLGYVKKKKHTPVQPTVWVKASAAAPATPVRRVKLEDEHQHPADIFRANIAATLAEETREDLKAGGTANDVWDDQPVLLYLRHGRFEAGTSEREQKRIMRRASGYTFNDGRLIKKMPDKSGREVPAPADRLKVIQQTHEFGGHFGIKLTLHLVMLKYWWRGMLRQVQHVVSSCEACSRVKATFNAKAPELQPLEISGMFYRWGVDLAGPFPSSDSGFNYIMICVEYYTKHLEVVPLVSKSSHETARAFLNAVIARFGACAEVVTDGGREFKGEFQELLEQCFIDHRITSPNHPQADGLAERAVQTVKRALRKACLSEDQGKWDEFIPWLLLGYRCSRQASTGYSPYTMLYAVPPTVPPAIKQKIEAPIDFDDVEAAADAVTQRAKIIQAVCVMAGENLRIAQHRDTLRYAMLRGGAYAPKLRRFEVGDFVYVRHSNNQNTLMPKAKQGIYRVAEVRDSGVLVLQGKCARLITTNVSNCAPCHIPDIDPTLDPSLAGPDAAHPCEVCNFPDDEAHMILCDACGGGYHTYCLSPPLARVPRKEVWICPKCQADGITEQTIKHVRQLSKVEVEQPVPVTDEEPTAQELDQPAGKRLTKEQQDIRAKHLHGRIVVVESYKKGKPLRSYARVVYVGKENRPRYFDLHLENGAVLHSQTFTYVKNRIMPEGTEMPEPETLVASACTWQPLSLPEQWDLKQPNIAAVALSTLMPGHWPDEYVSRVHRFVPGGTHFQAAVNSSSVEHSFIPEVQCLMQLLNFGGVFGVVDPFATSSSLRAAFEQQGVQLISNNLGRCHGAEFSLDTLQPGMLQVMKTSGACMDVIVSSPWAVLIDLALPLAVKMCGSAVCMRVPGHYLSAAPAPRKRWLTQLAAAGRLLMIAGVPTCDSAVQETWLVSFADSATRERMLNKAYADADQHLLVL